MEVHNECNSWVVKSPFTTNCDFRHFCGGFAAVLSAVVAAEERFNKYLCDAWFNFDIVIDNPETLI